MQITLVKEKTHKNGDVTFTFDIDKEFKTTVKKFYKKKKYNEKLGKLFIIEALYQTLTRDLESVFIRAKKLNGLK